MRVTSGAAGCFPSSITPEASNRWNRREQEQQERELRKAILEMPQMDADDHRGLTDNRRAYNYPSGSGNFLLWFFHQNDGTAGHVEVRVGATLAALGLL